MQHLNIFRQEHDPELLDGFIQLIPLTPDTSLRMTSGGGSVNERALMFAILKQLPSLTGHLEALEVLMTDDATISWHRWAKSYYEDLVQACEKATGGKYLGFMLNKVADYLKSDDFGLLHQLFELLNKIEQAGFARISSHSLIKQLRIMFAKISIDLLEPDFVIMDEFQRFKFLLESSEE